MSRTKLDKAYSTICNIIRECHELNKIGVANQDIARCYAYLHSDEDFAKVRTNAESAGNCFGEEG